MNTSKILFRAAQIIERDGWCQDVLVDELGRVCAVGAIDKAQTGDPEAMGGNYEPIQKLENLIGADVVNWNNAPERTAEEVIDMLVIASIEALEQPVTREG